MKTSKQILAALDKARREGRLTEMEFKRPTAWNYVLSGPLPPSTNHLFATGKNRRRFKTKPYKLWLKTVADELRRMPSPPEYPVQLYIVLSPGDDWSSLSDVANREKAITDAIVAAGVIPNDTSAYVAAVHIGLGMAVGHGPSVFRAWFKKHDVLWHL